MSKLKTINIKGKRKPMSEAGKEIRRASVHRYWEGRRGMFLLKNGYLMQNILRRRVYVHRKVWQDANGAIPHGYHIHHKNGIRTDNRLENLELMTGSSHSRMHALQKGLGKHVRTEDIRRRTSEMLKKCSDRDILQLKSGGLTNTAIAKRLNVSQPTISRRLSFLSTIQNVKA